MLTVLTRVLGFKSQLRLPIPACLRLAQPTTQKVQLSPEATAPGCSSFISGLLGFGLLVNRNKKLIRKEEEQRRQKSFICKLPPSLLPVSGTPPAVRFYNEETMLSKDFFKECLCLAFTNGKIVLVVYGCIAYHHKTQCHETATILYTHNSVSQALGRTEYAWFISMFECQTSARKPRMVTGGSNNSSWDYISGIQMSLHHVSEIDVWLSSLMCSLGTIAEQTAGGVVFPHG